MPSRCRGWNWKYSIEHKAFYAFALRSHTMRRQIYSDYSLVGTNLQFICAIPQPALFHVNTIAGRGPFEPVNENRTCVVCTVCVGDCVLNVLQNVAVTTWRVEYSLHLQCALCTLHTRRVPFIRRAIHYAIFLCMRVLLACSVLATLCPLHVALSLLVTFSVYGQ